MRREKRNEEQPIQPPMKTNNDQNLVEEVTDDKYVDYLLKFHLI
jgi:hypothetical protein